MSKPSLRRRGSARFTPIALPGLLVILAACGARSEPGERGGVSSSSCGAPQELTPLENTTLTGFLGDFGRENGWCGQDGGAEDVYLLPMQNNRDLKLRVLPEKSDFEPVIRIEEDGCGQAPLTRLCTPPSSGEIWHVLLLKEHDYYVTVDAPGGEAGEYAVKLAWARPGLGECDPLSEPIDFRDGDRLTREGQLEAGQGVVSSVCGGPGTEHMYELQVPYSGVLSAFVETDGFEPLLSLRTGCPGISEQTCSTQPDDAPTIAGIDPHPVEQGRSYWLVVDQVGVDGGSYQLELQFR